MASHSSPGTVILLNPNSGAGDHGEAVREEADSRGYALRRTGSTGDAIEMGRDAARDGYTTIVAAGGDGTVNEVVRGIDSADAFEDVELGVLPCGTGNNFARNIGLTDLASGFDAVERGERRRIDLGLADGTAFVNSCIAGLTADSSSETSSDMKRRLGPLAYVITTLRTVADFESLRLTVDIGDDSTWRGDAIGVLVGNGRDVAAPGGQADMEDGLLDVAVIEDVPTLDLMGDAIAEGLFGEGSPSLVRTQATSLAITVHHPESTRFSLDGEIVDHRRLRIRVWPDVLTIAVGESYDPTPA